ncbi:MAG: hypothetical protein JWM95_1538 [Gemmatimonadetes bacterium]|nr:hypothetical protein [Gemmatimonadota bacterium]
MNTAFVRSLVVAGALVAPLATASAQTHVFQLNGSFCDQFNGSVCLTQAGGGTLGLTGFTTGATATSGAGQKGGLALSNVFNAGSYVVGGAYSIVIRGSLNSITDNGGYKKIVDFKNFGTGAGYYSAPDGDAVYGTPYYQASNNTSSDEYGQAGKYIANTLQTTILTYNGSGLLSAYVDGIWQFTTGAAPANEFNFTDPNATAQFFSSNVSGDQTQGYVDYIATYDHAICSGTQGCEYQFVEDAPSTTTPEPASMVLLATGLVGVAGFARRRRASK